MLFEQRLKALMPQLGERALGKRRRLRSELAGRGGEALAVVAASTLATLAASAARYRRDG